MNDRQKAILYRARHRGSREADFLVGGYIDSIFSQSQAKLNDKDTCFLEEFVALEDGFLIDIISVDDNISKSINNPFLKKFYLHWRNKQI